MITFQGKSMPDSGIATAADYADAMMTARRAKNGLVLLLLLCLLIQLALFFLVRFDVINIDPTVVTTMPANMSVNLPDLFHYVLGMTTFLGLTLTIVLGFVLLLIANIMMVGRLIGAGRVTGAYIWCLVLLVLLFPWQSFLNNAGLTPDVASFKIPGALCTWAELSLNAHFSNADLRIAILKWARFVAFPVLAILILLTIQVKSNRGIRQAMGEEDFLPTDTAP
jgi:hypothetical protein